MDRIGEAIMTRVRAEADGIVAEARSRAGETLARARTDRDARLAAERARMLEEAKVEAARVLAQSAIAARQELLKAKTAVVEEIFDAARKSLASKPGTAAGLRGLVAEGVAALGAAKARVLASPREAPVVRELLKTDRELADRITEVAEAEGHGGVIVEDVEGRRRVDNTYGTRLTMLRPSLLVEIGRELAGA
jgi:V/A-type H+-transporting ATPase subunit E